MRLLTRPLLIGESNPYGADPSFALYFLPRYASGNRLRLLLGLSDDAYEDGTDRVNLVDGDWDKQRAGENALSLQVARPATQPFVLLGAKVRDAFGWVPSCVAPWWRRGRDNRVFVGLPHPSGRNRAWSEPDMMLRCRAVLTAAGVLEL